MSIENALQEEIKDRVFMNKDDKIYFLFNKQILSQVFGEGFEQKIIDTNIHSSSYNGFAAKKTNHNRGRKTYFLY